MPSGDGKGGHEAETHPDKGPARLVALDGANHSMVSNIQRRGIEKWE
jgi:hypothetical protein